MPQSNKNSAPKASEDLVAKAAALDEAISSVRRKASSLSNSSNSNPASSDITLDDPDYDPKEVERFIERMSDLVIDLLNLDDDEQNQRNTPSPNMRALRSPSPADVERLISNVLESELPEVSKSPEPERKDMKSHLTKKIMRQASEKLLPRMPSFHEAVKEHEKAIPQEVLSDRTAKRKEHTINKQVAVMLNNLHRKILANKRRDTMSPGTKRKLSTCEWVLVEASLSY